MDTSIYPSLLIAYCFIFLCPFPLFTLQKRLPLRTHLTRAQYKSRELPLCILFCLLLTFFNFSSHFQSWLLSPRKKSFIGSTNCLVLGELKYSLLYFIRVYHLKFASWPRPSSPLPDVIILSFMKMNFELIIPLT